jgi:hypothetical protein
MRKLDIAQRIHQEAGIPLMEANVVVDRVLTLFKTILQNGEALPFSILVFSRFARNGFDVGGIPKRVKHC